jgi:hypothetical protein
LAILHLGFFGNFEDETEDEEDAVIAEFFERL